MLIKREIFGTFVQSVRFYSNSLKKEALLIQKTTYKTDEWTNINSRFEPFVGTNLHKLYNHPLRKTQEEVSAFFKNWFNEHVNVDLPIYKDLGSIEPNTSAKKMPNVFYVNKDLMLRHHTINQEIQILKSGKSNFLMVVDLYRRCQMDAKHFPAFHRINVIRTMDSSNVAQQPETAKHLIEEQQTALIEMAKHFLGTNVQYRWTDANFATTQPSWVFEIHHQDEWHRISGSGLIRNEMFTQSERLNTAGWEIGIGLDRLAMILYNIFDVRLLWNSSHSFLKQFEPKPISEKLQARLEAKAKAKAEHQNDPITDSFVNIVQRPTIPADKTSIKKSKYVMNISYIVPEDVDLQSFPIDDLCKCIQENTLNAAEKVTFVFFCYINFYSNLFCSIDISFDF